MNRESFRIKEIFNEGVNFERQRILEIIDNFRFKKALDKAVNAASGDVTDWDKFIEYSILELKEAINNDTTEEATTK